MKGEKIFSIFLVFLALAIAVLIIGKFVFKTEGFFFEKTIINFQGKIYSLFQFSSVKKDDELQTLKNENLNLIKQLADKKNLDAEIRALRDQFKIAYPASQNLMPAKIIGMLNFIPQVTDPEKLIIDKGSADGVYPGQAVVVGDSLLGRITKISKYSSLVELASGKSFSLPARDLESGALGIVRGNGSEILLDNVLLSENLKINDVVLTKGSMDENGKGIPPDLIIGKISSIDKDPSALFQKAKIKNPLNYSNLSTVFLVVKQK